MPTLTLDVLQTVSLGVVVFIVGRYIKSKIHFLQKYFIPAPVIGGLLFSLIVFALVQTNTLTIEFDPVLQNFFMNIFFTVTGFTISLSVIKKSGKLGTILAIIAVLLLVIQNALGAGLANLLDIHPLLGLAMGSTSMSGGVGSAAAFGPTFENLGALGGTTVGVAAATFGLLAGSIVGGPVAKRLIEKFKLTSTAQSSDDETKKTKEYLDQNRLLNSTLLILLAAGIGSIISYLLNLTGLTFPYYVGCLFAGAIFTNIAEAKSMTLPMSEINIIGNISLNLFLSLTLMSLNISALTSLALPMIVILLSQVALVAIYAYFITFRVMGKSYEASVMAAGHVGVGLGQTPNAVANMSSIIEEHGPAPTAWFVLPVITVVFINIFNPIIITLFINILS
ncbi:sodium/glutamate symporter [Carnobacterium mobile]|uniref:sodium/glutamate symporter n=1 Tax=Carnobacterium mobile TaxID=2750 RepID=UPI001868F794|nr:sodium/glutamate symporter [Carnobacterium mobile]